VGGNEGMQPASGHGVPHRGLRVPCVFWPSAYVHQEICSLAASPDGQVVAAACCSGQVYIWHCTIGSSSTVRLDPAALAVHGWLGPSRVLGLDFCWLERAVEVAGVSTGLLLVCLLAAGHLRLLDTTDGRCIAALPPRACADPLAVALRVAGDGRHAVLAIGGSDTVVLDLWSCNTVATMAMPGDFPVVRLAAPRFAPWSLEGRAASGADAGGQGGSQAALCLAGASTQHVFAWRWCRTRPEPSGGKNTRTSPSFTFDFVGRGRGTVAPVSLALEGSVLLLGLEDRVLLWILDEGGSGARLLLDGKPPVGSDPPARFTGLELIVPTQHGKPASTPSTKGASSVGSRPRARSLSPVRLNRRCGQPGAGPPMLIAWTTQGSIYCDVLDLTAGDSSSVASVVSCARMQPWGSLPDVADGHCLCWWCCGTLVVAAALDRTGDSLHIRGSQLNGQPTRWVKSATLAEIWQPVSPGWPGPLGIDHRKAVSTITCAVLVEVGGCTWLALGLGSDGRPLPVCAVVAGGGVPAGRRLPLPDGFGGASCLASLGPRFLVAGDVDGLLCWWALADWSLAGCARPLHRASVVSIARVWSPAPPNDALAPEHALVAALDETGKCRLVDLATGDILCLLQSQCGPSLWLDEPLRLTYDPSSRYVFANTPARSWVWDSASGVFQGSAAVPGTGDLPDGPPQRLQAGRRDAGGSGSGAVPGFRCSALRYPGFGIESVAWQVPSPRAGEVTATSGASPVADQPAWWLGEVLLDGPLWRLPVVLASPAGFLARIAPGPSSETRAGPSPQVQEARGLEGVLGSAPWLAGPCTQGIAEQLASLGVRVAGGPLVVGVLGVDDSLSFPLPRRQGPAVRSLSPRSPRAAPREEDTPSMTGSSEALLSALLACGPAERSPMRTPDPVRAAAAPPVAPSMESSCGVTIVLHLPTCQGCVLVGLMFVARLLLHADAPQQVLQGCAIPSVYRLMSRAPLLSTLSAVASLVRVLQTESKGEPGGVLIRTDMALRNGGFGSASALHDVATLLLALVANVQPQLFEKCCPPQVAVTVVESLCALMFSRGGGPQLQCLACEVFAMGFQAWRRHLVAIVARHPVPGGGRSATSTSNPGRWCQRPHWRQHRQAG